MTAADLVTLLEGQRFPCATEERLQVAVADHFIAARVPFTREHRLSADDRVDFLVGDVAVELKTKGSLAAVTRQLMRYAQYSQVRELLLVTSRVQLAGVPKTLNGKPVHVSIQWGGL